MKDSENKKASIVFHCEDIEVTHKSLKENGVEFLGKPSKMEWGIFAHFKDEDGNEYLLKQ